MVETARRLIVSAVGEERMRAALAWLQDKPRAEPLLIVGSSLEAANRLVRYAIQAHAAVFGWQRESLGTLVGKLAAEPLARKGLAPIGELALEAVAARVVFMQRELGELGRFTPIADRPGLARALARTIGELGMAGVEPEAPGLEPDLARLYACYRRVLGELGFADRARVHEEATRVLEQAGHAWGGLPVLLWDVRVSTQREAALVAGLTARAVDCLASAPPADLRSLRYLRAALGVEASAAAAPSATTPQSTLRRLQLQLFEPPTESGELGDDVAIMSAPGEAREAVEVARKLLEHARRGVRFDRMAVLLRAPELYRAHLIEALQRAQIPAYFSRGALRPEASGRALLALLACAGEGLSAARFAEYLSLGVSPRPSAAGEPPQAREREERWLAPQDELMHLGAQAELAPAASGAGPEQLAPEAAAPAWTPPSPRRWERLLVEAAVLGGRARWQRRLLGLERELSLQLESEEYADDERAAGVARDLEAVRALSAFALPLIAVLDELPQRASWGEWLDALSGLATRALADPGPVLQAFAELAPMSNVGPVEIAEVRLVLERRLGDALVRPASSPEGRVFVGTIEEARGMVFDSVFVPGLAEKIFPPRLTEDPLLLDAARVRVSRDLAVADDRLAAERCGLQVAVGAASARLIASYPRFALDKARPRVPSFYGLELLRAACGRLPGFDELVRRATDAAQSRMGWPAPLESEAAIDAAEYDLVVLQRFLAGGGDAWGGAAHYLLSVNPHLARALRFRARRWHPKWFPVDGLVQPSERARSSLVAHQLTERTYSATSLEQYARCPYKFYLAAIAGVAPRKQVAPLEVLDPMKRGVLIHEVLRRFLTRMREERQLPIVQIQLDTARHHLEQTLAQVAAEYHEQLAPAIERVWQDGLAEIGADLREWLLRSIEDAQWTPAYFELGFGLRRADSDPASDEQPALLAGGLRLRGSIDLVETQGGELRATDFKTGKAPLPSPAVIGGGKHLQPLLYALALAQRFPAASAVSGQAYYCTSRAGFVRWRVALDAKTRGAAQAFAETIGGALAQGFFPAAPERGACELCQFASVCGPYEEQRVLRKDKRQLETLAGLRSEP
jgi:RecB family exonuclease